MEDELAAQGKLERELATVTEQRDRLAEALELLVTTDHESKEAFIERVKQALAAVKGGCDDN
jgi:6-phosphogluconate dehydrogenase